MEHEMNPNAVLNSMLVISENWIEWGDVGSDPQAVLDELSEGILSLHDWITQGGSLPDSWMR